LLQYVLDFFSGEEGFWSSCSVLKIDFEASGTLGQERKCSRDIIETLW
jgi:hypothetical protein